MLKKPFISVIIPALNEEQFIAACVESIQDQEYKNYELIVVDNGSKDHTALIAKKLGAQVIAEPLRGLPQAREAGRLKAKGELLVYLDADMVIPKNYLSKTAQVFETHKNIVATSNPFTYYDSTYWLNFFIKIFFKLFVRLSNRILKLLHLPMLIFGGNFAVRAEALRQIGGFNTHIKFYGEDADLAKRLAKTGKIFFIKNIWAKTSARRLIREGVVRTNFNYLINYLSVIWKNHPARDKEVKPWLRFFKLSTAAAIILLLAALSSPTFTLFGQINCRLPALGKRVALTFDDGPNGKYTEKVLKILDQKNIKATFFLIGKNVEVYPDLTREIVRQGHSIGNHSYSHPWRLPFENRKSIWAEIIKAEEAIYNATGLRPKLFRPPHGLRTPWMLKELKENDYLVYTWDDMTDDYLSHVGSRKIIKKILRRIKPGTIIVLHDGLNLDHRASRENTLRALPEIIERLRQDGYEFITIR